jgi:hypothetical protein
VVQEIVGDSYGVKNGSDTDISIFFFHIFKRIKVRIHISLNMNVERVLLEYEGRADVFK